MAMTLHSRWMGVDVDTIVATGGAAVNTQILQVMADVFGAEVHRPTVTNSAALGAALRAWHAHALATSAPLSWDAITNGLDQPTGTTIVPIAANHEKYRELISLYEQCEQHALGQGEDPSAALEAFAAWHRR